MILTMKLITAGIILTFVGFMVVFLSALIPAIVSTHTATTSPSGGFAGLVMIGPIPIFIGSAPNGSLSTIVGLGIILTIIAIIFFVISWLLAYKWAKNRPYPPM